MATSADSLQKRYTAGGCVLDVTYQLSALSQWHPRPVCEQLTFQLWLEEWLEESPQTESAPVLVAEGDRKILQAITHHIAQQTRATLTIASLNTRSRLPSSSAKLPPDCLIEKDLSYLQLCDLTTVLTQYEQAVQTLPVSPDETLGETLTSHGLAPNSFAANNLIPFSAVRRRPRLWASSAAAAIFAIGLTTTLWSQQRPQQQRVSSEISPTQSEPLALPPSAQLPEPSPLNPRQSVAQAPTQNSSNDSAAVPSVAAPSPRQRSDTADRAASDAPQPVTPPLAASAPPSEANPLEPNPEAVPDTGLSSSAADTLPANQSIRSRSVPPTQPSPDAARTAAEAESPEVANAMPEAASNENATDATIRQVRDYFQSRWQPDSPLQPTPLLYQIQLSETGNVVSFVALNDAAQAYRDRLLPPESELSFSGNRSDAPLLDTPTETSADATTTRLTLRLTLTADGKVQISKL
ncbi:MAG: hypothetical protein WBD47_10240 [Phormidesmis sp.]